MSVSRLDEIRATSAQRRAQQAAKEQAAQRKREALLASRAERAGRPRTRMRVDASKGTVAVAPVAPPSTATSSSGGQGSSAIAPPPAAPPAAPPPAAPVVSPDTATADGPAMTLAPTTSEPERVVVDTPPVEVAPLEPEPAPAAPPALPERQGLSTGAKVALGVGALAATATVVALVVRR